MRHILPIFFFSLSLFIQGDGLHAQGNPLDPREAPEIEEEEPEDA